MLPCHENLVHLRLIDIPCVVVLFEKSDCVLKKLKRRSIDIRIRKCYSCKNEMVSFPDRVITVWEPQIKSIILDSLNS